MLQSQFLSLNLNKTYSLQFRNINEIENSLDITYVNKTIRNVPSVMFLGLPVNDTLSWDQQIIQTTSKLISAFYAVWTLTPLL